MAKWISIVFLAIFMASSSFAQNTKLEIKGTGNQFYLDHLVAASESFYSIGRMYNVAPKDLASFNKLPLEGGLSVGQTLKIPLDKNNFTQSETKSVLDFFIPVHHTVQSGETLYRLGVNYNKVPLESLKKWNALTSDAVNVGSPMIVGFLKVDKNQSPLARGRTSAHPGEAAQTAARPATPPAKEPVQEQTREEAPMQTQTAAKKESAPQKEVATNNSETSRPVQTASSFAPKSSGDGGPFGAAFSQQNGRPRTNQGAAGVFKSTSGWQDAKYYCFHNEATPGSVIRIANNTTGRFVYAKVLDVIPDIRQNSGLTVIVSNAAADVLGAGDSRFDCTVEYYD